MKKWISLSEEEIEDLSVNCLKNSITLLKDAIFLFKRNSFSSAFFLSIISLEEFAKVFILDDLYYYKTTEAVFDNKDDIMIRESFKNHKFKHKKFMTNMGIAIPGNWMNVLNNKNLEILKQNAIYVDIDNPLNIKKQNVIEIITIVFKSIIYLINGLKNGYYTLCIDDINLIITPKQFYNLKRSWKFDLTGN
jgi:AbiV family abortive infection protein